jgi:hypothetical protein
LNLFRQCGICLFFILLQYEHIFTETTSSYDRKTDYIDDCKKIGIVPASYFLRHMDKPHLTMSHHGLGNEEMKCIAKSLAVSLIL